ncbi:DUF6053 domain-containing protein [Lysobacter enzymogenes]|uniref:DUF6053 domain-containing protein n=1 Tax=Lysobacter enzymogenes TaxID=69 RepID=UPI0037484388
MGGPSAPMLWLQFAAIRPESVGPEGPPTTADGCESRIAVVGEATALVGGTSVPTPCAQFASNLTASAGTRPAAPPPTPPRARCAWPA